MWTNKWTKTSVSTELHTTYFWKDPHHSEEKPRVSSKSANIHKTNVRTCVTEQVVNEKINKSPESNVVSTGFYDLGQRDITACICSVSGLCYLHKEGSIQCLRQVIITAEKGKLLRSRQLPSQHVGFLQLHQLFPEGQKLQLTHTHT